MTQDWDFYTTSTRGYPASIFVDLSLLPLVPQAQRPHLLRVRYPLQMPGDDGLSQQAESEMLDAVEDELFAHIARGLRARYVGRITGEKHREHFYYGVSADGLSAAVEQARQRFPHYEMAPGDQPDADWTFYKDDLFPGPIDLQAIWTRRQIDQLIAAGHDVATPLPIVHSAEFPTVKDRDRLADQVEREGFELIWPEDDANGPFPYALQLVRRDRADLQFLDPLVTDLLIRTMDCNGRYQGWSVRS